jgi:rhomboid protease GluP
MTFDWLMLWTVAASCAVLGVRSAVVGASVAKGWLVKCLLFTALTALAAIIPQERARWALGALWAIVVPLPLFAGQLALYCTLQQRYGAARLCVAIARTFHPFDGLWQQPRVLRALAQAERGEMDRAAAVLSELLQDPRLRAPTRGIVRAQLARVTGDWESFLQSPDADHPALLAMRVRALGETGRLRDMIAEYRRSRDRLALAHQLSRLIVLAFCGRPHAVAALTTGALATMDFDTKALWLATAELAAGQTEKARLRLDGLASRAADRPTGRAAERRLLQPLALPRQELRSEDWQVVAAAEADTAYSGAGLAGWRHSHVTIGLIVLTLAAYGIELSRGTLHLAIFDLSASSPPVVDEGRQYWRWLATPFLSGGIAHLGSNLAALAVLGPWVERVVGHWRLLAVYLGSAIGSAFGLAFLIREGWVVSGVTVGASGAIFGLIGAQAVLLAQAWRKLASGLAAQRLAYIALAVLLQMSIDLAAPRASLVAHAGGFLAGLGLAALLLAAAPARFRRS